MPIPMYHDLNIMIYMGCITITRKGVAVIYNSGQFVTPSQQDISGVERYRNIIEKKLAATDEWIKTARTQLTNDSQDKRDED